MFTWSTDPAAPALLFIPELRTGGRGGPGLGSPPTAPSKPTIVFTYTLKMVRIPDAHLFLVPVPLLAPTTHKEGHLLLNGSPALHTLLHDRGTVLTRGHVQARLEEHSSRIVGAHQAVTDNCAVIHVLLAQQALLDPRAAAWDQNEHHSFNMMIVRILKGMCRDPQRFSHTYGI